MKNIKKLRAFEQIKLLADERRMLILRLLMSSPSTLTQLAKSLRKSPAWVRHHILALEAAGLIELGEIRTLGKVTEKFYRVKAGAYLLQELILPESDKPIIIFSGSHDLALEDVAEELSPHVTMLNLPVGSLDGLVNLRQRLCQISGAHLVDAKGNYNTSFVRHFFPDRDMRIITLAHRSQGLMFARGNPQNLHSLIDLARPGLRFINRNPGSGTRVWLDAELKRLGIPIDLIQGYQQTVNSHTETAHAIAEGWADTAIGLHAAAQQYGLDFIPIFNERYDLIFPREFINQLDILLNHIQSARFRNNLAELRGYESVHTGEQVAIQ